MKARILKIHVKAHKVHSFFLKTGGAVEVLCCGGPAVSLDMGFMCEEKNIPANVNLELGYMIVSFMKFSDLNVQLFYLSCKSISQSLICMLI